VWLFELLSVFYFAARGREGIDVKRLQRGEDLFFEKLTLLIRLHVCSAIPQTNGIAGILIGRILGQPACLCLWIVIGPF
jgi:hypothetical protein